MRDSVTLRVRALDLRRTTSHRWHNFAESVCGRVSEDGRVNFDMAEVDGPSGAFHLVLRAGLEKRVRAIIDEAAVQHLMVGEIGIEMGKG